MHQWIHRHRRRPHAVPHTGPFQGSKTPAKYDYAHVTMVVKRCGFYVIHHARPVHSFPPSPRVRPQRRWQRVAWCHGFTFHACPPTSCRRWSPTSRMRHPRLPATASKNVPSQERERTSQQHRLSSRAYVALWSMQSCQRRTAAFNRTLLTNEYRRVGKRIRIWMFYSKFEFSNFV